jgi:hypothetical protein
MDSQRFEFESEAWYRAVAEGRLSTGSDRRDQYGRGEARPPGSRSAAYEAPVSPRRSFPYR